MLMQVCATLALVLIVYHHLIYPLLIKQWFKKAVNRQSSNHNISRQQVNIPGITLVIPAYNEAAYISEKIANLGFIDYPADKLRIIIACDGCTDQTAQLARVAAKRPENSHLNLEVREFKNNRGKVAIVNQLVASLDTPWVALSDVSALISIDAFNVAHQYMITPDVGVICSHYQLLEPGSEGEAAYWKYQSQIKVCEAQAGATIGAHGACYLFRRDRFTPMPEDTINDDFILPMTIVAQGYRAVYEPDLHAFELEKASHSMDYRRRIRISAGNLQQVLRLKRLLMPQYGAIAFNFFSGKFLRVLMPYLMLLLLLFTLILSRDSWVWGTLLMAQLLGYASAAWVYFIQLETASSQNKLGEIRPVSCLARWGEKRLLQQPGIGKVMKLINYLVAGHLANLLGSLRYIWGLEKGRW
ncbi:glycosyltransferase family 2 protein [Photobacterium sagamiensis]|uniref:glycosyltransferase family 2 protein n=1 Tax=Photobacterium sagamiensis TaxID=2910241 RepID=UPI003D138E79